MKDAESEKNPYEIALIGYSQAGKTTLAVGLYATSTEEFTVTGKGEETESYLRVRKAALESGAWLDATTEQQMPDIRLAINRRGKKSVEIDFKEYMGERACNVDSYKRDVIGNPRGAMILMNPSMQILRDPVKRNEMIGQIKDIIAYLSEPDKRCDHIAFVVTASDLLKTSLSDFKDEFDGYAAEITNCLRNNAKFQNSWKEFEVTVTGPLDDPTHPRIAAKGGNTSREPFEWLVGQIEESDRARARRKRNRRFLACAATISAVCGLFFAGWYWGLDRVAERRVGKILSAYGALLDQAVEKGDTADINSQCATMENALLSVLKNESPFSREPFFASNEKRYRAARTILEQRIEGGRLSWYPAAMADLEKELGDMDPKKGITFSVFDERKDRVTGFDRGVKAFSVKMDANRPRLSEVRRQWEETRIRIVGKLESGCCEGFRALVREKREDVEHRLLAKGDVIDGEPLEGWRKMFEDVRRLTMTPNASAERDAILNEAIKLQSDLFVRVDQHNGNVLRQKMEQHVDVAAAEATEEKCGEWRRELEAWMPFTEEGRGVQKGLLSGFDEKKASWRVQYESKKFEDGSATLLRELVDAKKNLDDGTSINEALVKCKEYESLAQSEDANPQILFETRKATWNRICEVRGELIRKLLESQLARMKTNEAKKPPQMSDDDRQFLKDTLTTDHAISDEEYGAWMQALDEEIVKMRVDWVAWQNGECEKFIAKLRRCKGSEAACDMLSEYKDFCSENPLAPKLDAVASAMNDVVMDGFREVYSETRAYAVDCPNTSNQQAWKTRNEKMQKTYNGFKELVLAASGKSMEKNRSCARFRETAAYEFAQKCLSEGGIMRAGVKEAFPQKYTITRIDAMVEGSSSKAEFKAWLANFDDVSKSLSYTPIDGCATLRSPDMNQWKIVWRGRASVEGTPWHDAIFEMQTLEGVWDIDKASFYFQCAYGENLKFNDGKEFVEYSSRVAPKAVVHVRVYIQGAGLDFFAFAYPYLFNGGK